MTALPNRRALLRGERGEVLSHSGTKPNGGVAAA
jgi:hypothetical protein